MEKSNFLRYKALLLEKHRELSTGRTVVSSILTVGEPAADPIDMAASRTEAAMQIRLRQTDGKLLRAIEDALMRIQHQKFGVCEECGQSISKARLEAVPWTRHCKDCKERVGSRN